MHNEERFKRAPALYNTLYCRAECVSWLDCRSSFERMEVLPEVSYFRSVVVLPCEGTVHVHVYRIYTGGSTKNINKN